TCQFYAATDLTAPWRNARPAPSLEGVLDVPVLGAGQAVVKAQQHGRGQGAGGHGVAHEVGVDLAGQGDAPVGGLQVLGAGVAGAEFAQGTREVVLGVFAQFALFAGLGGDGDDGQGQGHRFVETGLPDEFEDGLGAVVELGQQGGLGSAGASVQPFDPGDR